MKNFNIKYTQALLTLNLVIIVALLGISSPVAPFLCAAALVTLLWHKKPVKGANFKLVGLVALKTSKLEGGRVNLDIAQIQDCHKATREVLRTMSVDEIMSWVNIGK